MAEPFLWIDDDDLRAAGFRVAAAEGLDDLPAFSYPTANPEGGPGPIVTSEVRRVEARRGTVRLVSRHANKAAFEAAMHVLREKLNRRSFMLRSTLRTNQQISARLAEGATIRSPTGLITPPFKWTQEFPVVCDNPWWEDDDAAAQSIALSSTPVAIPCGTETHYGTVRVNGPGSDPDIIYRNFAGTIVAQLSPTVTLGSGDWWEINLETGVVQQSISSIVSDATNTLPDDFDLFGISRLDGSYAAAEYPTLSVSLTGLFTGRRRWA